MGRDNVLFIHVTLIPYIKAAGEMKTKPTQHGVMKLREIGIEPSILICRMEKPLTEDLKAKIAMFCNVEHRAVIDECDVGTSIYEVPLLLRNQKLDDLVLEYLHMDAPEADMKAWEEMVHRCRFPKHKVTIAVAGKYTELKDAYKSIWEAITHGGVASNSSVDIVYQDVESETLEEDLSKVDGILVPGGFGDRGIEGKIAAIKYARENNVPFFGVCLGMQCAVIEFARNVLGLKDAHSSEFNPKTKNPIIYWMAGQKNIKNMGGTMRLGSYACALSKNSTARAAYKRDSIKERHRHRYEFNNKYRKQVEANGLTVSGMNPEQNLVEIVELKKHPWFVGVQFHPEFLSRPTRPHPLFRDFVSAALVNRLNKESQ
jgi:CTP synthase